MDTNTPVASHTPTSVPTQAAPPRLPRALGAVMAIAVVIGTVIGSGVFKKPAAVAQELPHFGWVAVVWILGGLLALLGALALAEVAVLFPKAGGNYVFLREGYGRMFGFLWGWVEFWIIRTASIAALATIFTEQVHAIVKAVYGLASEESYFAYWDERLLTVGVIAVLAAVNVRGVRWGGLLQVLITSVKIGSLLAIVILPFVLWGRIAEPALTFTAVEPRFQDFGIPWKGMGVAMLGVMWAYHGWMNIAPIAEEVRQPQRNIPLALLGGVGTIIALYLGANLAYHLVIPMPEMATLGNTTVATEFCLRLLGHVGAALASAAVMFSVFGALNGNLLVGPRLLYAMGQDNLAPRNLYAVHAKYKTPALAIIVVAVWSCLLVLGGAALSQFGLPVIELSPTREINLNLPKDKPLFDVLTDFAMFGAMIFETMAVSTIFVFRWRLPSVERPYRCFGYPLVPIVYVLVLSVVACNTLLTQHTEAATAVAFIFLGAGIYLLFLRARPQAA
jgi:basic amino acid/polyamine antiporter, APA family